MDREWLENEYVVKDRSTQEIADEYGCKRNTIQQWLAKYKIKKQVPKQIETYDYLYRNYVELNRSLGELANTNHVTVQTVKDCLQKNGIEIRPPEPIESKYEEHIDDIVRLYVEEKVSANQIGKMYGTSHSMIITLLHKYGIETRGMQEAQFAYVGKEPDDIFYDANELDALHHKHKLSCHDIGDLLNISPGAVRRQMNKLGVKTNNDTESKIGLMIGNKHPNWQGGKSSLDSLLREYCHTNIRPKVFARDKCTCQICGCNDPNMEYHAHHIIAFEKIVRDICNEHPEYDPEDPDDKQVLYKIITNDPRFLDENNFATLCIFCHINLHAGKIISSQARKYLREGSETISKESTSEAIADGSARGLTSQSVI